MNFTVIKYKSQNIAQRQLNLCRCTMHGELVTFRNSAIGAVISLVTVVGVPHVVSVVSVVVVIAVVAVVAVVAVIAAPPPQMTPNV